MAIQEWWRPNGEAWWITFRTSTTMTPLPSPVALMPLWRGINEIKSGWNQVQYTVCGIMNALQGFHLNHYFILWGSHNILFTVNMFAIIHMQDNFMCFHWRKNICLFVCLLCVCLPILVSCRLNGSSKTGGYHHKDILTEGCSTAVSAAPDLLPWSLPLPDPALRAQAHWVFIPGHV